MDYGTGRDTDLLGGRFRGIAHNSDFVNILNRFEQLQNASDCKQNGLETKQSDVVGNQNGKVIIKAPLLGYKASLIGFKGSLLGFQATKKLINWTHKHGFANPDGCLRSRPARISFR